MSKGGGVSLAILLIITIYFGGTLISYFKIEEASFGVTEYLLIIALVVMWTQFLTWRSRKEVQKDEMGKQIIQKSSSISYNILVYVLLALWVVDVFFISKGTNYTLFIAVCVAYITNPLIQYIQIKKYM